uniref:Poly(ADP-ribose) polymerase family member 15 n=1 Tax=Equus asinus TaxID=9793 RepID=A0A9L0I9H0_EQUAS
MTENVLSLFVESISGLSEANGNFRVEVIPNIKIAGFIFLKNIDVRIFVTVCHRHHKIQQLQIFPRLLELTRTIKIENLPPHVDNSYVTIVFGNPQNGEGVTNV